METPDDKGSYAIKGGKTFLGKIFAYQEKTGMTPKQIMRLPYIYFVISMYDAPSIDYDKKKKEKEEKKPFGTPISELSIQDQAILRIKNNK